MSIAYCYPKIQHFILFIIAAFCIRAFVFYAYIQYEERYCQPDSIDYHICALCLSHGYGMSRPDNHQPIFWRTPGYPLFLMPFYNYYSKSIDAHFEHHAPAHRAALLLQIILCSFIPVLVFMLTYTITELLPVAWITSLIVLVHPGFILNSTFLLTDGLGSFIFIIFLLFFFRSLYRIRSTTLMLCFAAFCLGIYTWFRPMGQFVALFAALPLLISTEVFKARVIKIGLFITLFFITISPWIIRNHRLTGKLFFCPLFGLYLNAFNAPKIIAQTMHIPLKEAHKTLSQAAARIQIREHEQNRNSQSPHVICGELVCLKTALPVIYEHPFIFIYDWIIEVIKTTFDLYSYQLVALEHNHFKWDPLIEYLPEKITSCLWKSKLPTLFRMIAWLEFIFMVFIWLGIIGGIYLFLLLPVLKNQKYWINIKKYSYMWLISGILIGAVIIQSGGFGYARLRLPVEPLIIMLGVTFWWFIYNNKK